MLAFLFVGMLCFYSCEASIPYKIDDVSNEYEEKLGAGCARMPTTDISEEGVGNFDQQCLRLAKIAETVGYQTESIDFAVQILSDLKSRGASDELLTIFVDLFARVAPLTKEPVRFSYNVVTFLIQIAKNGFCQKELSCVPVLSELICRSGLFGEKEDALLDILARCYSLSEQEKNTEIFGWSLDVFRRVLPYVTEQPQVGTVFNFLEGILLPIRERPRPPVLLHSIPPVIGACLTKSGGLGEAFGQIWGLLHNDPNVLSQMMNPLVDFSQLSALSGPLVIVLLAKLGEGYFSEALPFFQTAAERICKLDGQDQLFSEFVASVLNLLFSALQEENNEVDISCLLVIASAFLEDWIVPDELENEEIHSELLDLLELAKNEWIDPEQKDQKIAEFLENLFDSGRFGIPLQDYKLLADLFDLIGQDKTCYTKSTDALSECYEFLNFLPFKQRVAFIGSISSQLRFLFQYLTTHTLPG